MVLFLVISFLKEKNIFFMPDQDILNYYFQNKYELLPDKYNTIVKFSLLKCYNNDNVYTPAIYHYSDHMLTFLLKHDKYSRLFWYYFMHTPFFNIEFIY